MKLIFRTFIFVAVLTCVCQAAWGQATAYPYVDNTSDPANGYIIVCRDANGGVRASALRSMNYTGSLPAHTAADLPNTATLGIPYKLQVQMQLYPTFVTWYDANTVVCTAGWRLPSITEGMLISTMLPYQLPMWTATTHETTPTSAYVISPGNETNTANGDYMNGASSLGKMWAGRTLSRPKNINGESIRIVTRCVRDVP